MKILCACEESQALTIQLRLLGHEAYSCDLQVCSGGHPEWHIHDDVLKYLYLSWDMVIAFPPCTYLSYAGNRHFYVPGRSELREAAVEFFMKFVNCGAPHICIVNPVGYMNSFYRKPDQIINPYDFGDNFKKRTCLWLYNLPLLMPDYKLPKPDPVYVQSNGKARNWVDTVTGSDRQIIRFKLSPGIARAMAYQFTNNFYLDSLALI